MQTEQPATCPHPKPYQSAPRHTHNFFKIHTFRSTPRFSKGYLFSDYHTKICIQLSSPPQVLHASPNSLFLISSPEKYLVRSADHAAHYALCSYIVTLELKNLPQHLLLKTRPAHVSPQI
jgi:hypothetical protein